ncbi:1-acyl-sn-glycerol-3-phosphate acyltransferase [Flammeovirga yaeyamensis]|uniref:1-acyl-sn-glycerol-3-phosphate acyltransferase n=1 Tax=Flammeovirga yaeyamensis TaxID=367791 RepID=A0AAX1NAZ0_9BACT|nr:MULTISPECIES: 1-acyl-sn-glycerol-3-phosphate acyltransferase [Flammeovirga]ANQ49344.2 acyltransferase [Flammeovirga sp. MY04]MBB3697777.1 1-acyl-sn-glycerol-3-phosphate acyltransferase [Flammeovirga yaeyamensis]NMF35867.1 acyltransferase [Flammeovirga yaeyamensis]QWG03183.1 1-acyl-sn-glycerol-3-phosphate acyltransferase [Flammeovirga yaeyamensis]
MIRLLFNFFYWLNGWKLNIHHIPVETMKRSVFLAAPHTTNWDAVYMVACMRKIGIKLRFAIKKDWIKFPLNIALSPMGAVGIDRSPKVAGEKRLSMVEAMANLFETNKELALVIPPEGSRSLREEWKSGFYYVALTAKVPILLAYLDYEKKEGGIIEAFEPTGDIDADMKYITKVYQEFDPKPKFPEMYSLDKRYIS